MYRDGNLSQDLVIKGNLTGSRLLDRKRPIRVYNKFAHIIRIIIFYNTKKKMMGSVIRLNDVLMNVALETNSGSVLNWSAYIVVLAAVGMAATMIMICLTISPTGKASDNRKAIAGETASLRSSETDSFR